jgi:hypothetical protein
MACPELAKPDLSRPDLAWHHLFDPSVPAEDELLLAHASVSRHVEDHEQIRDLLGVHPRNVSSFSKL